MSHFSRYDFTSRGPEVVVEIYMAVRLSVPGDDDQMSGTALYEQPSDEAA